MKEHYKFPDKPITQDDINPKFAPVVGGPTKEVKEEFQKEFRDEPMPNNTKLGIGLIFTWLITSILNCLFLAPLSKFGIILALLQGSALFIIWIIYK
jgi:hypothetical protein